MVENAKKEGESSKLEYDGPHRYRVGIRESRDGSAHLLLPALGEVRLHPDESVFVLYSPGMPFMSLYTYTDISDIVPWIAEDQKALQQKTIRILETNGEGDDSSKE